MCDRARRLHSRHGRGLADRSCTIASCRSLCSSSDPNREWKTRHRIADLLRKLSVAARSVRDAQLKLYWYGRLDARARLGADLPPIPLSGSIESLKRGSYLTGVAAYGSGTATALIWPVAIHKGVRHQRTGGSRSSVWDLQELLSRGYFPRNYAWVLTIYFAAFETFNYWPEFFGYI